MDNEIFILDMEESLLTFKKRRKVYLDIIKNIKRKRPIANNRLDSFAWWNHVEVIIQNELLGWNLEKLSKKTGGKHD